MRKKIGDYTLEYVKAIDSNSFDGIEDAIKISGGSENVILFGWDMTMLKTAADVEKAMQDDAAFISNGRDENGVYIV